MATRTVTGIDTIPQGVSGAGTVSVDSANPLYIRGTGTSFLSIIPNGDRRIGLASRHYIFIPAKGELIKIVGFINDELLLLDAPTTALNDPFTILKADVQSFEIRNNTATAGILDGNAFAGNAVFNSPVIQQTNQDKPQPPHWVDATNTSFLIIEN